MQAVILAGGLGTRLRPITEETPKPMVLVAGKPYLEHQLRLLRRQGITDIVLLTGYLGEQIEKHFREGGRLGVRIRYSREGTPLGTGGALREAVALLGREFLVIYGDSYLPIDYRDVLSSLRDSSAIGLVVVYDNGLADTSVRNNIGVDERGLVVRYDKESANDPGLAYVEAGVLAFRREVVELLSGTGLLSLEREVFPKLIARQSLLAYRTMQRFYDIGTPERLRTIEAYLSHDHHSHPFSD